MKNVSSSAVVAPDAPKILCLGYTPESTQIFGSLFDRGWEVWHTDRPIDSLEEFDWAVSFGYRHIIGGAALATSKGPVFNLHISYLPFNRGAHPAFWSFFDDTPLGVSIHLIDEGVDTGPILYQSRIELDPRKLTFREAYNVLISEVEELFIDNLDEIAAGDYRLSPQGSTGTMHSVADLPKDFSGWDAVIAPEIARLRNLRS